MNRLKEIKRETKRCLKKATKDQIGTKELREKEENNKTNTKYSLKIQQKAIEATKEREATPKK